MQEINAVKKKRDWTEKENDRKRSSVAATISVEKENDVSKDNDNDTMHENAKENVEIFSENKKKRSKSNE